MSSDDNRPTPRVRTRRRPRAIEVEDAPPRPSGPADPWDPGPHVRYPNPQANADGSQPDLSVRIRQLRAINTDASRDLIMVLLFHMLLQQRPMDDIARSFGVHVATVYRWKEGLGSMMAKQFKLKPPLKAATEQLAHHERARAYAWQQVSLTNVPLEKQRWIIIAQNAEKAITNIYEMCGIYKMIAADNGTEDEEETTGGGAALLGNMSKIWMIDGSEGVKQLPQFREDDVPTFNDGDLM